MESLTFIIIAVIITSIGFLIGYQMIRLRKNVDKITDQIIEHHKGDRSFRDKEFVHYFKAGGNIWLSAMDDKFKKMLSMQKYTAMAAIVVAVVIIALSIVQRCIPSLPIRCFSSSFWERICWTFGVWPPMTRQTAGML